MADNTTISKGTVDGDVIATDDISGIKHQQVKVEWGADGTATPVTITDPLPVVPPLALIREEVLLEQILGELVTMNYHLNLITEGEE